MGQEYEMNVPGYESLAAVLSAAFDQAAKGKGKERHAEDNKPFDQQPMQLIADRRGIGFILGQADKKSEEAQGMLDRGEIDAAIREILGAIVYLAGSIIHINRHAVVDEGGVEKAFTWPENWKDLLVVKRDEHHYPHGIIVEDTLSDGQGDEFAPIDKNYTEQGYLLADGTYSGQYKVGDKFRVVRNDGSVIHSVGDVLTLDVDDGSLNPWFNDGVVCSWWKLVLVAQEKPTAKAFTLPENWKELITSGCDYFEYHNGFTLADGSRSGQYKVGDKFWVVLNQRAEPVDEPHLVTYARDDGSACPEFAREHEVDGYFRYWWKLIPAT